MSPSWKLTVRTIIIALLIGGLSGILATALTARYLTQYAFELDEVTQPLRLTVERPRAVPQVYADALRELEGDALPAVGLAYAAAVPVDGFTPEDARASVVALTSDGWLLSVGEVPFISIDGKTCKADQTVRDFVTGLAFVHCEISGVPVANLGEGYGVKQGDQVFVVDGRRVWSTTVSHVGWGRESVRSSDAPARRIQLADAFRVLPGASVFNLAGELVGLLDAVDAGAVIPFEHIEGAFTEVLDGTAQIERATLGVRFIDLSRAVGLSDGVTRGNRSGALLYGSQAVKRGSAASQAGLFAGDVVLSVDGVSLNSTTTLDDLIATYAPGSAVRLLIDRVGTRIDVTATLGSTAQ